MIPGALITRATLDGVAQTYATNVLPTDPDTCVLWDALQVSCGDTMDPPVNEVVPGSVLHHWLVLDAIQSAESVPQGKEGRAAIEAARAWLADPCERTRRVASDAAYTAAEAANAAPDTAYAYANATYSAYAAAYAAANATDAAAYAAAYAAYALAAHASYTAAYADYVTANAAHTTNIAVNATNIAIYARVAAQLRFRVLATMATAGVLPAPKMTT